MIEAYIEGCQWKADEFKHWRGNTYIKVADADLATFKTKCAVLWSEDVNAPQDLTDTYSYLDNKLLADIETESGYKIVILEGVTMQGCHNPDTNKMHISFPPAELQAWKDLFDESGSQAIVWNSVDNTVSELASGYKTAAGKPKCVFDATLGA